MNQPLNQNDSPKKTYGRSDNEKVIDFMRFSRPAIIFSIILSIISLGFIVTKGLNLGLDFTGGISAEVVYDKPTKTTDINQTLVNAGFKDPIVQTLGSERNFMLRMPEQDIKAENLSQHIEKVLITANSSNPVEVLSVDSVGSQVGSELFYRSLAAVAIALVIMLIYITIRFEFKLAVGAVLSLFHDVIVVLGLFAFFQWNFDLTVLAALLAVIGFSLNDNIVVSDRIRENFRKIRDTSAYEITNISLTETLRRTIHTSLTLLLVVLSMLLAGGDGLKWFSIALFIGVFVGTYSSIYISTAYALWRGLDRNDFIVQVKPEFEEEEEEAI